MTQVKGDHAQAARWPQHDAPATRGPWRVLVLDRSADDPMWAIATITLASDVRPADLDAAGRYVDWDEVTEWVRAQVGARVALVPVHDALAWRIDADGQPR